MAWRGGIVGISNPTLNRAVPQAVSVRKNDKKLVAFTTRVLWVHADRIAGGEIAATAGEMGGVLAMSAGDRLIGLLRSVTPGSGLAPRWKAGAKGRVLVKN